MFEHVLVEQNPHWDGTLYQQGIEREILKEVIQYLSIPHVISVTGVRRAGKSTILKQTINFLIERQKIPPKNIVFVNLEHPYFSQYSKNVVHLEHLFDDYLKVANPEKGPIFCFLDEIQFFDQWPVFVKAHYEQKRVKFIITGSNSFLMSHELLTMLSGRTIPVEVYPLSFREFVQAKTEIHEWTPLVLAQHRHELRRLLDGFLRFGGFPEIALLKDTAIADDILNAYSKTILYQDVASRLEIKKPLDLEQLYYYLISHVGTYFSYSSLSKIFDLSDKTIKEYIEALIDANLLFEIDRFSFSMKHQIRSEKKIYAIDPGMVNATAFQFSKNEGKLFENTVYLELKRRKYEVYYYKTKADHEVDFVAKQKTKTELIQVCVDLHKEAEHRELRALVEAAQELKLKHGTLVTADLEEIRVVDGIEIRILPLYKFVSSSGN